MTTPLFTSYITNCASMPVFLLHRRNASRFDDKENLDYGYQCYRDSDVCIYGEQHVYIVAAESAAKARHFVAVHVSDPDQDEKVRYKCCWTDEVKTTCVLLSDISHYLEPQIIYNA